MMPSLTDYLAGKPLSEELARVKAGTDFDPFTRPKEQSDEPADPEEGDLDRDLTRSERIDLQHTKAGAGWLVVTRLIKRALRRRELAAINLSQHDPLKNQEALAREWAYVAIHKAIYTEIEVLIEAEIALSRHAGRAETGENASLLERDKAER